MTIDTAALKASANIVSVVAAYLPLKKRGSEFVGKCPFHDDKNPSLFVSPAKQFCYCFSCGASHDVISFVQEIEGIDFQAACEKLGATKKWEPKAPIKDEAKPLPARVTSKPPPEAPEPNMKIRDLGEPSRIFRICDTDGSLIAFEARYDTANGKETRIWSWGARGDRAPGWGVGALNVPRPLYGLERLGVHPQSQVIVTEGPKKADAARDLIPQCVGVSWTNGANSWHKHDWSALAGRNILIWPDADEPGKAAAEKLAALLSDPSGLACRVRIIRPNGQADGWDVADAMAEGWDNEKTLAWAKAHAHDFAPQGGVGVDSPSAAAPPAAVVEAQDEPPPHTLADLPPAAADAPEAAIAKPARRKRHLAVVVDGNTVRESESDPDDDPLPASMSEDFLAENFALQHGDNWRYVKPWGQWLEWRGDGWYRDEKGTVDRLAIELTRQSVYWKEAATLTIDAKRKINSRRVAFSVRDIACSDRKIAAAVDQWDRDPWLLGVPGGVVDLRDGRMEQAERGHYITKRAAVAPDHGPAPLWTAFLSTVTAGNAELTAFLQRFAGYCLSGETREQCLAFLYGTGQNGKGVFITTISRILGEYAAAADADVFMDAEYQRHPTELARLRGARLVYVDETDNAKRWNEKRIKRITGGGSIEARFMARDYFEFAPQFKLLIAGNHKPQLRGVGKAMQRRIHLVPFTVTIPDAERDDNLVDKLREEYPQILGWMIDGCKAWQAAGLKAPEEVREATAKYIEGEDIVGEWLEERTEQRGETERPAAYKNYRAWADARGERPWSNKAFWSALEERGYAMRRTSGLRFIVGMSLRQTEQPPFEGYEIP